MTETLKWMFFFSFKKGLSERISRRQFTALNLRKDPTRWQTPQQDPSLFGIGKPTGTEVLPPDRLQWVPPSTPKRHKEPFIVFYKLGLIFEGSQSFYAFFNIRGGTDYELKLKNLWGEYFKQRFHSSLRLENCFGSTIFVKRGPLNFKAGNEIIVCSNSNESYLPGISYVHSNVNVAVQFFLVYAGENY